MTIDITPAIENADLAAPEFHQLADVPPEIEWFANITNANTRRSYQRAVKDFTAFWGIHDPTGFRSVTRAHLIRWRGALEAKGLSAQTIRLRLSALSSLFEYLCENNAVINNPVTGVARPKGQSRETPPLSDAQVRQLLDAPPADTLKGQRDRAILATLLFHALRRSELVKLRVCDVRYQVRGVSHLVVDGKGSKTRYLPAAPMALRLIEEYLDVAGHGDDLESPLFRRVRKNYQAASDYLDADTIYKQVVRRYARATGIDGETIGVCVHSMRATATTNALENGADITKVQEWLGHADISTTRIYDKRRSRTEDSPTYRVKY